MADDSIRGPRELSSDEQHLRSRRRTVAAHAPLHLRHMGSGSSSRSGRSLSPRGVFPTAMGEPRSSRRALDEAHRLAHRDDAAEVAVCVASIASLAMPPVVEATVLSQHTPAPTAPPPPDFSTMIQLTGHPSQEQLMHDVVVVDVSLFAPSAGSLGRPRDDLIHDIALCLPYLQRMECLWLRGGPASATTAVSSTTQTRWGRGWSQFCTSLVASRENANGGGLRVAEQLHSLVLHHMSIDTTALLPLCVAFESPMLKWSLAMLSLHCNPLEREGYRLLHSRGVLDRLRCTLQVLLLQSTKMDDEGLHVLTDVSAFPMLRRCVLADNVITDVGARELAACLVKGTNVDSAASSVWAPQLCELNVSRNWIGGDGKQALVAAAAAAGRGGGGRRDEPNPVEILL